MSGGDNTARARLLPLVTAHTSPPVGPVQSSLRLRRSPRLEVISQIPWTVDDVRRRADSARGAPMYELACKIEVISYPHSARPLAGFGYFSWLGGVHWLQPDCLES